MHEKPLTTENTLLVLIDVQGRLAEVMNERDNLYGNLLKLLRGCRLLGLPLIWTEQIPEKMGATIAPLKEVIEGRPISKSSFSCCGEPAFLESLARHKPRHVLLAGIEAHVCVYQTAADLVRRGCNVQVVKDAVSSRTAENKSIGLERMRACGGSVTSVETVLFELMQTADHPAFRDILRIVK